MSLLILQKVYAILQELERDPEYQRAVDGAPNDRMTRLRQGVELTSNRCLALPPNAATPQEIRASLGALTSVCEGSLAKFRRFIERARSAATED